MGSSGVNAQEGSKCRPHRSQMPSLAQRNSNQQVGAPALRAASCKKACKESRTTSTGRRRGASNQKRSQRQEGKGHRSSRHTLQLLDWTSRTLCLLPLGGVMLEYLRLGQLIQHGVWMGGVALPLFDKRYW